MPRRKQLNPLHLDEPEQLAELLDNGVPPESTGEDGTTGDEHICGKCRLEFIDLTDFLQHKRSCTRKRIVIIVNDDSSDDLGAEGRSTSSLDFTDDAEKYGREIPFLCSSYDKHDSMDSTDLPPLLVAKVPDLRAESEERSSDMEGYSKSEPPVINLSGNFLSNPSKRSVNEMPVASLTPSLPQYLLNNSVPDTNVTLQTLENTRVAVAQQAAGATSVSHLAALHSALYTLQQQQIIQLQVIQQLQTQLVSSPNTVNTDLTPVSTALATLSGTAALTPPQSSDGSGGGSFALTTTNPSRSLENGSQAQNVITTASETTKTTSAVTDNSPSMHPLPPPPPNEPNTLELLQRHTEQALQNTMAGSSFLLNGLSGLNSGTDILRFCKNKNDIKREGSDDAYFRHRCRFCGKVFGSDSALQIHIRSHTGERPFKCNVCGNRFSTKGNLKVHFQRHKAKYPHIKMNPHPVPLHLDSLHPPLEPPEASDSVPSLVPVSASQTISQNVPPPNLTPVQPLSLTTHFLDKNRDSPLEPTSSEITNPQIEEQAQLHNIRSISPNETSNLSDETDGSNGYISDDNTAKDIDRSRYEDMLDNDEDSFSTSPKPDSKGEENVEDEMKPLLTENSAVLNGASSIPTHTITTPTFPSFFHPSMSPFSTVPMRCPPSTPPLSGTPNLKPSDNINPNIEKNDDNEHLGPSPDPNIYQDLLPKPGSNDNSWESLMEVTKTSETSKLQQLVDNIEHKLSDPNQCVICHRVLSCKSALQMHYRTHTGERPFKCKICSRAFTTKGNLKTHMGVHRVKPPVRVLHQCPVCHKQFTNSLVLQQHIRMHTGEPTDMHPEQIMANEIRSSPLIATSFQRPSILPTIMPHFASLPSLPSHISPQSLPPSCSTPKASEAPSLTPPPVLSVAITESVIKTVSKTKELEEETPVSPEPSSSLLSPSDKTERCSTPQSSKALTCTPQTTSSITNVGIRSNSPSMDRPIVTTAPYSPAYTASLVALENHVKAINTTIPQSLPFSPFGMGISMGGFLRYDDSVFLSRNQPKDMTISREKSPVPFPSNSSSPIVSHPDSDMSADDRSTPGSTIKDEIPTTVNGSSMLPTSSVITTKTESGALDLTPKTSHPIQPPIPEMKLFPSPLSGLPFPTAPGRLSTTCRICFKTFACNSALEIHYRSHTKERPFKCNVCDRGFSTKGNMKQHMLTHKIRDLPPQLFTTTDASLTSDSENSGTSATPRGSSPSTISPTVSSIQSSASLNKDKNDPERSTPSPIMSIAKIVSTPIISTPIISTPIISNPIISNPIISNPIISNPIISKVIHSLPPVACPPAKIPKIDTDAMSKRPLSDPNIASIAKRPSGFPKHFCHICQKPFSSASALQIHNRTHTGDKPFKCTICGRAFTTKGNLKVHMGTHMWNNGTSRRGRRMSLELPPLALAPHGKPDFSHHHSRQDLYFPYLPHGYLNGITGPPKMNEISVIQSATGLSNGNVNAPVSMALSSAVPMMTPIVSLSQHQQFLRSRVQMNHVNDDEENNGIRSPEEAENLKMNSAIRQQKDESPSRRSLSPTIIGTDRSPNWGWKISCNVCNKICSSSSELELHLKSHCNSAIKDTVRSAKQTAENIAS